MVETVCGQTAEFKLLIEALGKAKDKWWNQQLGGNGHSAPSNWDNQWFPWSNSPKKYISACPKWIIYYHF